jgi:hypothetical protein
MRSRYEKFAGFLPEPKGLRVQTNGLVGSATLALWMCLASALIASDLQPAAEYSDAGYSNAEYSNAEYSNADDAAFEADSYGRTSYWFAGAEFTFMGVNAASGGHVVLTHSDTTAPGVATVGFRDGDGIAEMTYAPRFWLGRQLGENWGVRGSFFALEANQSRDPQRNPLVPSTGTNFGTFTNWGDVEMSSLDLDVVRSFYLSDNWLLDVFGGVRHSSFDCTSGLESFGVFTTGNFVNLWLESGCQFDGTGPSLGFSSRSRLGNSNLYLLWSGRGSALSGRSDIYARAVGTIASSPSAPLVGAGNDAESNVPSTLHIIESQLGLQYEFGVMDRPFNCFVRCAFEVQHWQIDNGEVVDSGFGGTIGEISTNSRAFGGAGSATLVGLGISTGLTW